MTRARFVVGVLLVGALLGLPDPVAASEGPGQCVNYSPLGYCVDWDVPTPGGPPSSGGGGASEPTCYWVTLSHDLAEDPTIWFDFNLTPPPEGVTVVWQEWECSDGSSTSYQFRWIIPATPSNLAALARGRVVGALPQPTVNSSPPVGTASIVEVPVFVEVTNWTGTITDSECAGGLCVTVTATPALVFAPGEPGSGSVSCAGSGMRYDPDGPSMEDQAAAEGACAYAYRLRTGIEERPGEWAGSASVTWTITWTASSGATGSLPSVTRTTQIPRAVREVQAVVVRGETARRRR